MITLGFYHIYHEYVTSQQIMLLQTKFGLKESPESFPILCLIISLFGMFFVSDMVHQEEINKIIKKIKLDQNLGPRE